MGVLRFNGSVIEHSFLVEYYAASLGTKLGILIFEDEGSIFF